MIFISVTFYAYSALHAKGVNNVFTNDHANSQECVRGSCDGQQCHLF